jgi:hypothetical protein
MLRKSRESVEVVVVSVEDLFDTPYGVDPAT